MSRARRPAPMLLACAVLLAGCAGTRPPVPSTQPAITQPPAVVKSPALRIRAVGDIMLGTTYPDDRTPPNDGRGLLAPVAHWLRNADLTFGNVEGVLMDGGEPEKFCDNPSLCYLFRSPSRYALTLRDAGFDVVSLANNHARDFGEAGRSASMMALDDAGIAHTGRAGDIASLVVDGHRVAVAGFAPNVGSWSLLDIEGAAHLVAGLAVGHDIVIVSFHGGAEGADALHVPPGMETFYGEQRGDLRKFSRAVIDAGADLVIGHGPHVPRGLEIHRGRLIAYSLGNFATHWGISVSGNKGLAPVLDVVIGANGVFLEGAILSAVQRRPDGVFPDEDQAALRLMRRLAQEDFNGGGLIFDGSRLLPSPADNGN
ncbi:MAG TPA: CapA family protein [Gammaproteobacteria bacterium]